MALGIDFMTPKGMTTYHKVTMFDMNCMTKKVSMTLSSFANEEVRNLPEGRATFNKNYLILNDAEGNKFDEYFSNSVLSEKDINPLIMGYKYITDTDATFKDATEV